MRVFFFYEDMAYMPGEFDLYLGGAFILLIFEAGRRILGNILPTFCALFLAFAYFGKYIPGPFAHAGLSVTGLIEELYLTTDGLFGLVTGVSSTYIFTFIIGAEGFLKVELRLYERAMFFAAALSLITPGVFSDAVGLALLFTGYSLASLRAKGGIPKPTTG